MRIDDDDSTWSYIVINEPNWLVVHLTRGASRSEMVINVVIIICRNLENTERPVYSVKAHSQIVNAIDGVGGLGIGEGAPEIVTGSRDGKQ